MRVPSFQSSENLVGGGCKKKESLSSHSCLSRHTVGQSGSLVDCQVGMHWPGKTGGGAHNCKVLLTKVNSDPEGPSRGHYWGGEQFLQGTCLSHPLPLPSGWGHLFLPTVHPGLYPFSHLVAEKIKAQRWAVTHLSFHSRKYSAVALNGHLQAPSSYLWPYQVVVEYSLWVGNAL